MPMEKARPPTIMQSPQAKSTHTMASAMAELDALASICLSVKGRNPTR